MPAPRTLLCYRGKRNRFKEAKSAFARIKKIPTGTPRIKTHDFSNKMLQHISKVMDNVP